MVGSTTEEAGAPENNNMVNEALAQGLSRLVRVWKRAVFGSGWSDEEQYFPNSSNRGI